MRDGHTIPIDGGWSLWRCVWLRSAGFPARNVLQLAAPRTCALLDADRELEARACYLEEATAIHGALREVAADSRFREAVLWQNRSALRGTIDAFLRKPIGATDSKTREHQRLVASYLQRYSTKNDTIGFFGPVGWAQLGAEFRLIPGPDLLSKRTVYFEHWTIDTLAATLALDPELKPHLAPRRSPAVRVDGRHLWIGGEKKIEVPPLFARILAACDGATPARDIAEKTSEGPRNVYRILEQLVNKNLATWTIEIPVGDPHPEKILRRILEAAPDAPARASALAALSTLERALTSIARAAGDVTTLDSAIATTEAIFAELTEQSPHRRGGEVYAGRTLFYEDTVRDVSCTLGRGFIERLSRPLILVLESARWYTFEVARRYREEARAIYNKLRAEKSSEAIEYLDFWTAIGPLVSGAGDEPPPIARAVLDEAQTRWATLLGLSGLSGPIERSSTELEPRVRETFPAPHPGWPAARYCSPDVMIAAKSAQAIERGDYLLVIGETHLSINSLFSQVGIAQHPDPESLYRSSAVDLPQELLIPIESKKHASRADQLPLKPRDPQLEIGTSKSALPRERVLAVSELVVCERDGVLFVETRDGARRYEVINFLGPYLAFAVSAGFWVVGTAKHSPRVTIDQLVVNRESWSFELAETSFAEPSVDPFEQFANVRRWAHAQKLPRFVFVKVPSERKPFYLDFDSPTYVDIFVRRFRKSGRARISEMIPDLEHLWLVDRPGDVYTSELRIAAVDPFQAP